jgi:hypothetical protein
VGGLPWLNPADVREAKPQEGKKYIKKQFFYFFYFLFLFFVLVAGNVAELRRALAPKRKPQKTKKQFIFLNYFWSHVTSRSSAGPPAPKKKTKLFF